MSQHTLAGDAIAVFLTTIGMAVVAAILLAGLVALLVAAFRRLGEQRLGDGRRSGIRREFRPPSAVRRHRRVVAHDLTAASVRHPHRPSRAPTVQRRGSQGR
jgi:hypothetical protein